MASTFIYLYARVLYCHCYKFYYVRSRHESSKIQYCYSSHSGVYLELQSTHTEIEPVSFPPHRAANFTFYGWILTSIFGNVLELLDDVTSRIFCGLICFGNKDLNSSVDGLMQLNFNHRHSFGRLFLSFILFQIQNRFLTHLPLQKRRRFVCLLQ